MNRTRIREQSLSDLSSQLAYKFPGKREILLLTSSVALLAALVNVIAVDSSDLRDLDNFCQATRSLVGG